MITKNLRMTHTPAIDDTLTTTPPLLIISRLKYVPAIMATYVNHAYIITRLT